MSFVLLSGAPGKGRSQHLEQAPPAIGSSTICVVYDPDRLAAQPQPVHPFFSSSARA